MEEKIMNPLSFFTENQETYEEALKKSAQESSGSRAKYFKMDSDGTYSVRILPLAPTQVNGVWKLDRKGYEYPIKTLVLRIDNPKAKDKKNSTIFVNVCNTKYVDLSTDLIDVYCKVAQDKYGDDDKKISAISSTSFEGGLKWNAQRCMYVYDTQKKGDGLQLLSLSYSQYKDLEERKLALWKKLLAKNPKHPCPISSINMAYPVEITRKKEGKKTTYTFNVDTVSDTDELSAEEIDALMNAPRIPDVIYHYSKYQLEATVEFLKQYDEKMGIDVMSSEEIEEAIEKIKMELPSDDNSHFTFDAKDDKDKGEKEEMTVEGLWSRLEELKKQGIGDKSEEGQELRDAIRSYINDNELEIHVTRLKTNEDLLQEIDDVLENEMGNDNDSAPAASDGAEEEEEEPSAPEPSEKDEEEEVAPRRERRARPERRR